MPIKVVIIEDQQDIREMLGILIKGSNGFLFLHAFENAEDAILHIPMLKPDVVLVDIHLPQQSGIQCVTQLKSLCPEIQFLMCTSLENSENIFSALKAGANGYITKSTSPAKLLEAITEVYQGGAPMSAQIARKVVGAFHTSTDDTNNSFKALSQREQEILTQLSKGFRYKEIAEKLFISLETVRTHVRNIYEKLQVNSRTEAINKAFKH